MKIHEIRILNWVNCGNKFWSEVKERPTEPLVTCAMTITISWDEYKELIDRNARDTIEAIALE